MNRKKQLDIELMRIIAAFFVIFNHTGLDGYFLFSNYNPHSIQYWVFLFVSVFCKMSVPVFFMISGALMLNRSTESMGKQWLHRVLHMVVILLVWSVVHYIIYIHIKNESFNIVHFFSKLYDAQWNYSYWYLYAYIGFLLSLPLLQRLAQNLTNRDYVYLMILFMIFYMIVPVVQYLLWQERHILNGNLYPGWISSIIVIYPLIGYFLQHRLKDFWNKRRVTVLWIINIVTILVSCYLTYLRAKMTGVCDEANSQVFHSTFVLINAVAIFVTCQYINNKTIILQRIQKPVVSMGGCTFGIYLLHSIIKDKTPLSDYLWDILRDQMHIPPMADAFVYCVIIFVCGYVITLVMKKFPLLRRLVS